MEISRPMNLLETCTLGARPTLVEVQAYYLRPEIIADIFQATRVRDVAFIYRKVQGQESHLSLRPQSVEELRKIFEQTFERETELTEVYPWLDFPW